ncbi:hypothetical protein JW962_02080 [Candidatus Dojkabacteria bacterium]|nr:hypothetical protein [Candidatus Dojkabacteria bacterium]
MSTITNEREGYKKALAKLVEDDSSLKLFKNAPYAVNQSKFKLFIKKVQRRLINRLGLVKSIRPKRFASKESVAVVDKWKRRRMFLGSVIIVGIFIALRFFRSQNIEIQDIFLDAIVFAAVGVLLLLWIFWGELTMITFQVLAMFVGSSLFGITLFVQLFFLGQLSRFDEILSFAVILIFLFGFSEVVFLSANIVNVSQVRTVPLLQVAQTVVYIVGIISVYFFTLGLLTFSFPWYYYTVLFLVYTVIAYPIIFTFGGAIRVNLALSVGIGLVSFIAMIVLFIWPINYKIASIYPAMVFAAATGTLMSSFRQKLNLSIIIEYYLIIMAVIVIIYSSATYF